MQYRYYFGLLIDSPLVSKKDVVYSILFAQIAADIRYDRFTQTTDWLKYYAQTLEQMGWTIGEITK